MFYVSRTTSFFFFVIGMCEVVKFNENRLSQMRLIFSPPHRPTPNCSLFPFPTDFCGGWAISSETSFCGSAGYSIVRADCSSCDESEDTPDWPGWGGKKERMLPREKGTGVRCFGILSLLTHSPNDVCIAPVPCIVRGYTLKYHLWDGVHDEAILCAHSIQLTPRRKRYSYGPIICHTRKGLFLPTMASGNYLKPNAKVRHYEVIVRGSLCMTGSCEFS